MNHQPLQEVDEINMEWFFITSTDYEIHNGPVARSLAHEVLNKSGIKIA